MSGGRFAGRTVMLTGAAGGFGQAAARAFAAEGAALALCDLNKQALDNFVDGMSQVSQVVAQAFDLNEESALVSYIEHVEKTLGPLDVCVNNAGIGQSFVPISETDTDSFDRILRVNTRSVFLCLKHQLPGMMRRGQGAIVNVASAAGLVGAGHLAAYAASKHAVVGLTRSAADEAARSGVRVNALCPSFAPTPLYEGMARGFAARAGTDRAGADARITARIPMRRVAKVAEVVQAMLWLADPGNSFTTGQAVAIDGGLTAV